MKTALLIFSFFLLTLTFGQNKEKLGNLLFVKVEVWNTLKTVFEPKSYDLELHLSLQLNKSSHIVGTYGKTTYYIKDKIESSTTPGRFQISERIGTSHHRSSLMYRWFPYSVGNNDINDFLFIEAGLFFHQYIGLTNHTIYENNESNITSINRRDLMFYRYGPQINIGLSRRYGKHSKLKKHAFSPEFFIGVYYNQIKIITDHLTVVSGATQPLQAYTEPKLAIALRAKIGFGFFQ